MATSAAVHAVSEALRSVIEAARVGTPFPGITVATFQNEDFAAPPAEGVSIYLYRVGISGVNRNLSPRTSPDGRRFRPSLPLDLYYLVTPWAKSAARQQELLGWSIRAIEDHPTLPTDLLNKGGRVFRDGEVVDVVAQPLAPVEWVAVWEFNKALMRPSMTYVARMVQLDSDLQMTEQPRVQTRGLEITEVSR